MLTWKIVKASEPSVLYIYIYIYRLVIRFGKQIEKIGFGFDLTSFGLDQGWVNSSGITFLNLSFSQKML